MRAPQTFANLFFFPYNTPMRLMGIDYGTKNVGIALSDMNGVMAFPNTVLQNNAQLLKNIISIIQKEKVGKIVIGYSLDKNGNPNSVHTEVEGLMLDLTLEIGLPIHLQSEQYSTQAAIRLQGKNANTDASAAALILDGFITKRK